MKGRIWGNGQGRSQLRSSIPKCLEGSRKGAWSEVELGGASKISGAPNQTFRAVSVGVWVLVASLLAVIFVFDHVTVLLQDPLRLCRYARQPASVAQDGEGLRVWNSLDVAVLRSVSPCVL